MPPRPFPTRLVVAFALAMALIVGASGATVFYAGRMAAYEAQVRDLGHLTSLLRQWVPRHGGPPSAEERARLNDTAAALGYRITLVAGDGVVLFDTHEAAEAMVNHNDRPEVAAARLGGVGSDRRRSLTIDRPSLYVARLLDPADPGGIVVRASDPRYAAPALTSTAWAALAGSAAAAALLTGAALRRLLRRQWVMPLRALADTAQRMADGQWHLRAEVDGSEHVRLFSSRLNELAARAQQQTASLRGQQEDLRALVDALPDPILVVDPRSRLTLMNSPAASVLDVPAERAVGQKLVGVVNEAAILELFDDAHRAAAGNAGGSPAGATGGDGDGAGGPLNGTNGQFGPPRQAAASPVGADAPLVHRTVRLSRGGQRLTYQAVARRTPGGGVLIVLRDVTTLSATVQMKTDFVANASHELRTPIAALKVAVETLRDVYQDDPRQADRCLEIVDGHMRRLEEMLRDLLDLSRVETPDLKPYIKEVRTADLFALISSSMGAMASRKLVELRFTDEANVPPGEDASDAAALPAAAAAAPGTILGDERLLNLVLKNLVENSIKFTPPGGSVTLAVSRADADADGGAGAGGARQATISVTDTGIGIPPQHLDRVFERFYQVDASRTGSAGRGTGLGLAIVKHAIAAMGGTVQIVSQAGAGTTVTCALPQDPATLAPLAGVGADEEG